MTTAVVVYGTTWRIVNVAQIMDQEASISHLGLSIATFRDVHHVHAITIIIRNHIITTL
jgi:hypothetical protein